ncbi:hypothetical protein LEMLEM_LOCUS24770 [Lemmus lemmus]
MNRRGTTQSPRRPWRPRLPQLSHRLTVVRPRMRRGHAGGKPPSLGSDVSQVREGGPASVSRWCGPRLVGSPSSRLWWTPGGEGRSRAAASRRFPAAEAAGRGPDAAATGYVGRARSGLQSEWLRPQRHPDSRLQHCASSTPSFRFLNQKKTQP